MKTKRFVIGTLSGGITMYVVGYFNRFAPILQPSPIVDARFLRALVVTALICLAVPSPAISQESEQPLSINGMDLNTTQLQIFMGGMAYGVIYSNNTLILDGKPQLYCAPLDHILNGRLLWDLASQALEGPHEPDIVAIAALDELKKRYPCTK